jgi:hypothetical protein
MYGNMPLMSPEAKEAFSQYAGMYKDMRGDNKKAREEAKWMALMQAGFGIAGGTSPNAFANINQGVQPAMAQYQSAIKDSRKDDREAVKGLIELGLTKEKFMLEVQKLGIDADKAQKVYDATIKAAQIRAGAVAGGKGLKEVQSLYRIENSELDRIRAEQKKVFEDPAGDYKKAQLDFSLPATPANAEKRAKAQATMDSIYNKTAETIRPYVNRLGAADRALRGDNSDFDPNQYLYPFGKPSTFGKPSSTPKTTNVNPAQFDRG